MALHKKNKRLISTAKKQFDDTYEVQKKTVQYQLFQKHETFPLFIY